MADFSAQTAPAPSSLAGSLGGSAVPIGAELAFDPFCSSGAAASYLLAAYDAAGRQYWVSPTVDFASAPAPVGAWIVATLTITGILS